MITRHDGVLSNAFISVADTVVQETARLFAPICGDEECEPMDVYIAATVDQGGNIVNAFKCLLVPVIIYSAHRLNSMVSWGVGINGSEGNSRNTSRNPSLNDLIKRASGLVSRFSHSAVASDALKDIQREMGTKVLQPSRRCDTRYACALARLFAKSCLRFGFMFCIELKNIDGPSPSGI